eukprot:GFYU01010359.1.p1 GENE.GFYU01010359.1~~GFYU01010359.1.p1  ORF type:complete len:185 (+),score=60.83 GFYU01010359.1:126-680(+)
MGGKSSKLKQKEMEYFMDRYKMGKESIDVMYERFKKVDTDNSGAITVDEFADSLGIDDKDYAKKLFHLFDKDSNGKIDFKEFLIGMANLSSTGDIEEKVKFAFSLYDKDGSDTISKEEIIHFFRSANPGQSKNVIDKKVNEIMTGFDVNGDGVLSQGEFLRLCQQHPELMSNATNVAFASSMYS